MTEKLGGRLRRGMLWFLFASVLLIPKTLALRRKRQTWNALRLLVGPAGITLATAGWMWAHEGYARVLFVIVGLVLAVLALMISPERQRPSVDARSRELGALVVVKGGRYHVPSGGGETDTLLFVGLERLSILDTSLQLLSEIPLVEVTLLRAEPVEDGWRLLLAGGNSAAAFLYCGPFAEHFARVAESTVRSQLPVPPNPLPIVR